MNTPTCPFHCARAALVLCLALWLGLTSSLAQSAAPQARRPEVLSTTTLAAWKTTDGTPAVDAKTGAITLPRGSQLSRVFSAQQLVLRVVTRPMFAAEPAVWASLEIGPASLTFVRDAKGGGLVLLGDEPLALRQVIALDAEGRSRESLDLVFTFDRSRGDAMLTLNQLIFEVDATSGETTVEVAASAGGRADWIFERFEVAVDPDRDPSGKADPTQPAGPTPPARPAARNVPAGERAQARRDAAIEAWNLFGQDHDVAAEKQLTDANLNPKFSAEWHIESAHELTQMAFSFARQGNAHKAAQLAQRALEHSERAARKAARSEGQSGLASAADSLSAFINERLLGSRAGATASYQRAAAREPSGFAAREIERLKRIETETQLKRAR